MASRTQQSGFFAFFKELVVLILVVFSIRTFVFGLYQVPTGSMETTMLVGERFFADKFTYLFRLPRYKEIIAFNDPTYKYSTNSLVRLWEEYVWGPANWTKRVIGMPGQTVEGKVEDGKPALYVDGNKLDEPYLNKYPLIHVYPQNPDTLIVQLKKQAEETILARRLPVSELKNWITYQMYCSGSWKSYNPDRPFDKQPFYDIDPSRIIRDKEGEAELKWPGTPLEKRDYCGTSPTFKKAKNSWNGTDEFYVELGPDQYWVMGDNREGSHDSRFFGPIPKRLIHGKIVFRIWSNDSAEGWWIFDLIRHPIKFWQHMRWSRFFQIVR